MKRLMGAMMATALAASPSIGAAQAPSGVRDLVGARAPGGETQLQARGYVHIKTEQGDDRAWSYWWQPQRKECLSVAVMEGRFDSITPTTAPDCNQRTSGGDGAGVAAAAVGVAALIGAIALAHKSHNHEDNKHPADEKADADFERGYRDGLYSQDYHNYGRSDEYSKGYGEGVAQRDRETSYRDGNRSGAAGYQPSVDLNDLLTARAAGADAEMQRRGFRTVNGYQAGETAYTIRYNTDTRQCVQVAVTDGRVRYIAKIKESACR